MLQTLQIRMLAILVLAVVIAKAQSDFVITATDTKYQPTWDSLDKRPLPDWYDKAKVGIFIHWGVFSVPSFGSEWFWESWKARNQSRYVEFMEKTYPPQFTYQEFAKEFKAEFFDPEEWATIFKNSGAKYVVLTSKHHEGFTLWPSKYSYSWNSVDVGPHLDIIDVLSKAVRKQGMHFGLYHSLYEWFNPLYLEDKRRNYTKNNFVTGKVIPEMQELIEQYQPDVLWSDGDWEAPDKYWLSEDFLAWLYNDSPVKDKIVVNDRWGRDTPCHHGGYYTCQDRFNPGVLQKHKWENAMTIDKESWGFRRNAKLEDYLTTHELITTLIETVSCGGNILINVGPTKDGIITPIYQERLKDLGKWLGINGEAIYESTPWVHQNDTLGSTWYTMNKNNVYATTLNWPTGNVLKLQSTTSLYSTVRSIQLLGYENPLSWQIIDNTMNIIFPNKADIQLDWAWVIKIITTDNFI